MADVTRSSYNDSKNYARVVFQRNRDVLDCELNEVGQIAQVRETKALRNLLDDLGAAKGTAWQVTTDGVTPNQISIQPGIYTLGGYTIELFNPVIITGLSTPGGARTDTVWAKIDEIEVSSSADASLAVQALGETAIRQQARVTFGVSENASAPPANSGQPWSGGYVYGTLAHLYRSASSVVAANQIVDRRYKGQHQYAVQMANLFMEADAVTWDGTHLNFTNLTISFPQSSNVSNIIYQGSPSFLPADGDAVGFDGELGFQLRRNVTALTGFSINTPDGVTAVMKNQQMKAINALTPDVFLIAWRNGTDVILRGGVLLHSGDATSCLAHQPSSKGATPGGNTPTAAQKYYGDSAGNVRFLVDANGYPVSSSYQHIEESWERSVLYYVNASTLALSSGINATQKVRLWDMWDVGPPSTGTLNTSITVNNSGMGAIGDGYVTLAGNASVAGDALGIVRGNFFYTANSVLCADFSLSLNVANAAYNFKVGFTNTASQSQSGNAVVEHACAVLLAAGVGISLYTNNNGGTGTTTAAGVNAGTTLATAVRCRLYLYGANTPAGVAAGGAIAKLYVGGVLVATSTATMPAAGTALNFAIALKNNTASTANGINVGPIKVFWNSSVAGDRM